MAEFKPLDANIIPEIETNNDPGKPVLDKDVSVSEGHICKHKHVNGLVSFFNSKSKSNCKHQKSINKPKIGECKERRRSRTHSLRKLFSLGRSNAINQDESLTPPKSKRQVRQATLDGLSGSRISHSIGANDESYIVESDIQNEDDNLSELLPTKTGYKNVSFADITPNEGPNKILQQASVISQQDLMERDEQIQMLTEAYRKLSSELEKTNNRLNSVLKNNPHLTIDETDADELRDEFKTNNRMSKSLDDILQTEVPSPEEKLRNKLQKAHSEL